MKLLAHTTASVWLVFACPAHVYGQDRGEEPVGAVVLVVKILSSTHARLTTGVVVARPDESTAALVVVAADFVSRGDKILVLDGGTDLLRNGRSTRTVARSAEVGIAVLEADGLERAGIPLATEALRDPSDQAPSRFEFLAWPAAQDLSSGASVIRQSLQIAVSEEGSFVEPVPELPPQAGVLVNACGQLAGLVSGEAGAPERRIAPANSIVAVLDSAQVEHVPGTCNEFKYSSEPEMTMEVPPVEMGRGENASEIPIVVVKENESAGETSYSVAMERKPGQMDLSLAVIAALLVGIAGLYLWLRRTPPGLRLERETTQNGGLGEQVSVKAQGRSAVIRCGGTTVSLATEGDRVVISHRIIGEGPVTVALAGTPCLEGEEFLASEGDRLSVGNTNFRIRLGQTQ